MPPDRHPLINTSSNPNPITYIDTDPILQTVAGLNAQIRTLSKAPVSAESDKLVRSIAEQMKGLKYIIDFNERHHKKTPKAET